MTPQRPTLVEQLDDLFAGLWPGRLRELFDLEAPKPLAIGTRGQIAEALGLNDAQRRQLGWLLGRWAGRLAYLKALRRDGAMRCGLDGEPVEPVSRDHAVWARQRLDRAKQKLERRKAERARAAAGKCRVNAAKPTLRLGARP
jgi:sRNA-binding protein